MKKSLNMKVHSKLPAKDNNYILSICHLPLRNLKKFASQTLPYEYCPAIYSFHYKCMFHRNFKQNTVYVTLQL